ncbi:MAG: exodeoxyribonuclease V subunit beta [Proteobacteria bacterium]|nr:exodeoxyribonuclease V subunit beta [Pseudomonadota bacterium]
MASELLDPVRLPLWGSRLIEASAGTGKTWTIGALYVRLVLGHGAPGEAFAEPLGPDQILVMTFTRAATQELSERIRMRLAAAAACFRGKREPDSDDVFLQDLLAQYASDDARIRAAWKLEAAADAMDTAAVFTIDAWCQRMLREHAFDSGSPFDVELIADESELFEQAVRDVWRQETYPLEGATLAGVLAVWPNAEAFKASIRGRVEAAVGCALGTAWARAMAASQGAMAPVKAQWAQHSPLLRRWLLDHLPPMGSCFKANMVDATKVNAWFDAIDAWVFGVGEVALDLPKQAWDRLSCEGLRAALKKGEAVAIPHEFEAFPDLASALAAAPDVSVELGRAAAGLVQRRLRELKDAARTYGFEDLQERLDLALTGARGDNLRRRIRKQYPVVMIDEFQDTSTRQFSLFDRVYDIASNDASVAILLIGDPKQSIYAFRGADIQSYIQARRATAGRHYALAVNFRSTAAVVDAVNGLFERAETREGPGAFQFRDARNDPVPFVAVRARGRSEALVTAAGAAPAMHVVYAAELASMTSGRTRFAELCAEHMVRMLNAPDCGFVHSDGTFARLQAADIAVLVRGKIEADAVRRSLSRRGVASVYLSDRDSVFASAEAADLLRWLRAVGQPRDGRLARAAFASPSLELSLAEMAALATDDRVFEERSELLLELYGVWQRQGVLAMLRQSLHRLDLPARWLRSEGGERRLTNMLHLAEILQEASSLVEGEQALVRWMAEAVKGKAGSLEEQQVRLESEADLVKIVTIHKAKGLEYPVVYLPFGCNFREADDDESGEVDDVARLQEDLRLLYVALTRARHALWLGVAAVSVRNARSCSLHKSALGYLLGGAQAQAAEAIPALVRDAFGALPATCVEVADAQCGSTQLVPSAPAIALREPPMYTGRFERDWSISSFTALVRGLSAWPGERRAALQNLEDDAQQLATLPTRDAPRHEFPRGAFAGKFLHDQLAWLAGQGFGLKGNRALRDRLAQRSDRLGWGNRAEQICVWFEELVATPLPELGASLAQLNSFLPEMEFWFPVAGARAAAIDAICGERVLPGRQRAPLTERALQGLVMGFADLVFEWEGRWWVLDYKSNALGAGDADYTAEAIANAVAAHRYDVQAMLYLLALHRLLRARLGASYDPVRQLGGAMDLFIRGIRGPASGCFVMPANIELLERLETAFSQSDEVSP